MPGADSASERSVLPEGIPPLPENATPEQKDAHWFKYVYQGDKVPQLTLRAVVMGGILGMLMAASNLYTTLAIGWGFGVAITACVMSFVIWNALRAIMGGRVSQMSILENTCMASTASAAGYATGSTIATMFGALLLLEVIPEGGTAEDVKNWNVTPIWAVAMFTLCTGLMGCFLAIPLKRQMINHEQLRFPSGVAAAETLRSLYGKGKEAMDKAYTLVAGIAVGALVGILNTPHGTLNVLDKILPWRLPELVPDDGFSKVHDKQLPGFGFSVSVLLVAAGIITRMRVSLSMFIGSALLYWVVTPWLVGEDVARAGSGWIKQADGTMIYDKAQAVATVIKNMELNGSGTTLRVQPWSLWGGTALMVFASLTAVALQWKTIARAFGNLTIGEAKGNDETAAMKAIEVPFKWMVIGIAPVALGLLLVQMIAFNISWWAGSIAIAMSFVLCLVASRATGETDTTPVGAMGKVMQLMFAIFHPGQMQPNLASAGVAANSAIASADLLTDLKAGYLLGANPRRQFLAQFIGVFFGTLAIVPIWFLMVPTKAHLEKFAAPATRTWEAVARVLTKGIDYLPTSAQWSILIGALIGIVLPVIERFTPAKARGYLPSAMGLGLSWVVFFDNALGFFTGACIIWVWEMVNRKNADKYGIPLASGMIAGESLIKAIIAMTATAIGLFGTNP
ncbi:MAG: OPT/YSL family transporter [Phycisphaerales bacterium]|nr:OPT/YSL family transporter [Phycisphaerales bacterium]